MPTADPSQFSDSLFFLKFWVATLSIIQFAGGIAAIVLFFRRSPSLDRELARLDKLESDLARVETLVKQLNGIAATQEQITNIKARLDGFAVNRVTGDRMTALEKAVDALKADLRSDMTEVRRLINDHTRAIGQSEAAHD